MKWKPQHKPPLFFILFSGLALSLWGCDKGLAPDETSVQQRLYGFRGVIYFKNWPPTDSVLDLRVVAFKNYPPPDIVNEVLQGRARFTETLQPHGADSISYTLVINPLPPGIFPYVVVGQRFGSDIMRDWRAVGIYYAEGDTTQPGSVNVLPDSILQGINIYVDFRKSLPQP
ncbi:MAG: hypothetical protein HY707_14795 [Ignavibacteriae bacterium]|nr:hypothetical protein [Ignavibacteriota bacterium]